MDNLYISSEVLRKLHDKHQVSRQEVEQCFMNREGRLLTDDRPQNRTSPPTLWFVAETNRGRQLKIIFVTNGQGGYNLKSAFEPNADEIRIYSRHGRQ